MLQTAQLCARLGFTCREINDEGVIEQASEPKAKKSKKDKKEKKEKKSKKEKKEKKEKIKQRAGSGSLSGGSHSDASLQGRRSLEDDLRRKALLSIKQD